MDAELIGLINTGIAAVSGLTGALIAAVVTVSVARSTSARAWNREIFLQSKAFYLSMIESINDQNQALNAAARELENALIEARKKAAGRSPDEAAKTSIPFQRSPEIVEQVKEATAAFRSVLAQAVIYGDVPTVRKLGVLDETREAVTLTLNENNLPAARVGLMSMDSQLNPLYRSAQREITRHNLVAINSIHLLRGRGKARKHLMANIRLLDERDASEGSKKARFQPK